MLWGGKKNYNVAFILVSLAACLHIHEGIYGFGIIFIILVSEVIYRRKIELRNIWTILVSIIVILSIALPNILTDSLNISNGEFVYIYANYRHPHHLVASTWGIGSILSSLLLIILSVIVRGIYLYFIHKDEKLKFFLIEAFLFILSWITALGIMYIGVEKFHSVFVATLFIVKFFKYVGLMAGIWYVETVAELFEEGNYVLGFGVLTFAFSARNLGYKTILLCLSLMIWIYFSLHNYNKDSLKGQDYVYTVFAGMFFGMITFEYGLNLAWKVKIIFTLIILIFACLYLWKELGFKILRPIAMIFTILFIVCSLYGNVYELCDGKIVFRTPTAYLIQSCGEDIYKLAEDFSGGTNVEDVYLADPDDTAHAGWFQIISRRNCYVIQKDVPSAKSMLKIWYDRYQLTQGLFEKSLEEIEDIMLSENIKYILVDEAHFDLFDDTEDFYIFKKCSGDSYRMYKLNG